MRGQAPQKEAGVASFPTMRTASNPEKREAGIQHCGCQSVPGTKKLSQFSHFQSNEQPVRGHEYMPGGHWKYQKSNTQYVVQMTLTLAACCLRDQNKSLTLEELHQPYCGNHSCSRLWFEDTMRQCVTPPKEMHTLATQKLHPSLKLEAGRKL